MVFFLQNLEVPSMIQFLKNSVHIYIYLMKNWPAQAKEV